MPRRDGMSILYNRSTQRDRVCSQLVADAANKTCCKCSDTRHSNSLCAEVGGGNWISTTVRKFKKKCTWVNRDQIDVTCFIISLFNAQHNSNVRLPRGVLYNSKQLGMLTLTVEHNYICYYYKEFRTTTCFGSIYGPSSGCGSTYSLGYTSMRVVVWGRNGAGSRSHYVTGYHGPGCIWFDIVFSNQIHQGPWYPVI